MPAESVVFAYDGDTTATATISNATPGSDYRFGCSDPDSSADTETAVGTTLVLTVDTIGGASPGDTFLAEVRNETAGGRSGITVLAFGASGEFSFTAEWHFDGVDTVTVTFDSDAEITYLLSITDSTGSTSGSGVPGTGDSLLMTRVADSPPVDDYFYAALDVFGGVSLANRLFTAGQSGGGTAGNPGGSGAVTVPDAPTLVSATAGLGIVTLVWTPDDDGGSDITGYRVYRGSSGAEKRLKSLGLVTTYVDDTAPGLSYYKVTAVNSVGESLKSNELSATPTGLTISTAKGLVPGDFTTRRVVA